MKVKLLKKLRRKGRNEIHIYSITKQDGLIVDMGIQFSNDAYKGLFDLGDTKEEVLKKAETIYIEKYLNDIKE